MGNTPGIVRAPSFVILLAIEGVRSKRTIRINADSEKRGAQGSPFFVSLENELRSVVLETVT